MHSGRLKVFASLSRYLEERRLYRRDEKESTIEALCSDELEKLPDHEIELLWLDCDGYFDHDSDDGVPHRSNMIEEVARELYQKVADLADNEELKFDRA
jgi:hypothetical protein